jgi:hypothetical protein
MKNFLQIKKLCRYNIRNFAENFGNNKNSSGKGSDQYRDTNVNPDTLSKDKDFADMTKDASANANSYVSPPNFGSSSSESEKSGGQSSSSYGTSGSGNSSSEDKGFMDKATETVKSTLNTATETVKSAANATAEALGLKSKNESSESQNLGQDNRNQNINQQNKSQNDESSKWDSNMGNKKC